MDITVRGIDTNLSDRVKEYAEKKLNKLDRYLPNLVEARLELKQPKKKNNEQFIAQLTIRNTKGVRLRAEDKRQEDFLAAIDVVVDKMYRQIERYKGKTRHTKTRKEYDQWLEQESAWDEMEPTPVVEEVAEVVELDYDEEVVQEVVRRKQVLLTPMSEPEAIDQMELLGHSFFLFYNGEEDTVNVLYRREDGQYGILTPLID